MKYQCFLIKYAEIGIKGKNRYMFEDALIRQMKFAVKEAGDFIIWKESGRIFLKGAEGCDFDQDEVIEALKRVFGISHICPMVMHDSKEYDDVVKAVIDYWNDCYGEQALTFKAVVRRADKRFPMSSMPFAAQLGHELLQVYKNIKVDVHTPDVMLNVEIRDKVYIYSEEIMGPGGMPVGTNGKAMLLLSGGIDSPVAGYMIAKRGVRLDATYFHAPPYTSERAKEKVVELARLVARYSGPIDLHVINFTDIQMAIYEKCPHEELTIIMRRYMMQMAENIAKNNNGLALITGESLGQVASQTIQSLSVTNEVCTLPVFRPCIGLDKQEIVEISEKIGTFETSILPYEDCCTIFVAKHPVTKPNLNVIKKSERKLEGVIEELLERAYATDEVIHIR
ncbi:MAG: tRNA 4-thiouridine(8) synthase ThiI [Lachnospiraceae bacterium]|nr:tRNA 4-thiouridine(8) synthase ThiI [Lachnospiraceae bacterium]